MYYSVAQAEIPRREPSPFALGKVVIGYNGVLR